MKQYYFLFVFLLCSTFAFSQTPPNDEIQNAIDITSLPFTDSDVQTQNATAASGGGMVDCNLGNSNSRVYYKFTPLQDTDLNIRISQYSNSSSILVYQSSVSNASSDSQLTFIGDSCILGITTELIQLSANSTYYIVILNPDFATDIEFIEIDVPENDEIQDAIDIMSLPFVDLDVQAQNAIYSSAGEFTGCNDVDYSSKVYYRYAPSEDITLDIGMNNPGFSSYILPFESSVDYATSNTQLSLADNIECADDTANLQYNFLGGVVYYILIYNPYNAIDVYFQDIESSIIDIPDANLKHALVNTNCVDSPGDYDLQPDRSADLNGDGEIQFSEALMITELYLDKDESTPDEEKFSDLTGLENFLSLERLDARYNLIDYDYSLLLNLKKLSVQNNQNPSYDFSPLTHLKTLGFGDEHLQSLDLSPLTNLESLSLITGQLTELDLSPLIGLEYLGLNVIQMIDLDFSSNINLSLLSMESDVIPNIDLSMNIGLQRLELSNMTQLGSLDLSQNVNLTYVDVFRSSIVDIDLSQNVNLERLQIIGTSLINLDLSNNPNLGALLVNDNYFLESINVKNGNNMNLYNSQVGFGMFGGILNPNLHTICIDDLSLSYIFSQVSYPVNYVDDCSTLTNRNVVEGAITFDENNNGCEAQDSNVSNVIVTTTKDGINHFSTFTDDTGYYKLFAHEGTYSTYPMTPSNFVSTPNTEVDTFSGFDNTELANFCFNSNVVVSDLNIVLLPLSEARPGFDGEYQMVYENTGTTTLSGTVNLQFDSTKQSFVNASPSENSSTSNSVSFNYTNLEPLEKRVVNITMNTFTPPTVNGDDVLNFIASISPLTGDNTIENNTFNLDQIVVNSFDPNDKQVLQGAEIFLEQADEYLDYLIRFQNTGTASAINVVVTDELSNRLDWETISPISSSHPYTVQITNGRFVEFIFNDINLPAQQDDDAGSNGFIAFKIKPNQDVVVGDIINGNANIYFDFNLPIETNYVSTEIVDTLSDNDFQQDLDIVFFPNPTDGLINVKTNNGLELESLIIFGLDGKEIMKINEPKEIFDISELSNGIYFVKILTNEGVINKRILKN